MISCVQCSCAFTTTTTTKNSLRIALLRRRSWIKVLETNLLALLFLEVRVSISCFTCFVKCISVFLHITISLFKLIEKFHSNSIIYFLQFFPASNRMMESNLADFARIWAIIWEKKKMFSFWKLFFLITIPVF